MDNSSLLAPETYNIVSEIEKHASNTSKKALIYEKWGRRTNYSDIFRIN